MTAARKLVDPYLEYEEQVISVASTRQRRRAKRSRVPATFKVCFLAACCVAVSLLYLQQQVTSYHLNTALIQTQEQVNVLEQRNDHLMLNLESQRSLQKIEQLARTELGMIAPKRTATLVVNQPTALATRQEGRWLDNQHDQAGASNVFVTLAAWLNKAFPLGGVEAGTLRR